LFYLKQVMIKQRQALRSCPCDDKIAVSGCVFYTSYYGRATVLLRGRRRKPLCSSLQFVNSFFNGIDHNAGGIADLHFFLDPITISIVMMLSFASCEKVIDVKLNDAAKNYVIEANITNEPGNCKVRITQTKAFSENNDFPGIGGAIVSITDNAGAAIPLAETSQGNYTTNALNGTAGEVYAFTGVIDGQVFKASFTMPSAVNLDSICTEDRILFGDSTKTVNVSYTDPARKPKRCWRHDALNAVKRMVIIVFLFVPGFDA